MIIYIATIYRNTYVRTCKQHPQWPCRYSSLAKYGTIAPEGLIIRRRINIELHSRDNNAEFNIPRVDDWMNETSSPQWDPLYDINIF